jgi:hypothetical protein
MSAPPVRKHGKPFVSHRADRDYASTVLSVLAGAHGVGEGILGFFDTREARAIRLVCSELREAVAVVPWADTETRVRGNVGGWRASFPRSPTLRLSTSREYTRSNGESVTGRHHGHESGITHAGDFAT